MTNKTNNSAVQDHYTRRQRIIREYLERELFQIDCVTENHSIGCDNRGEDRLDISFFYNGFTLEVRANVNFDMVLYGLQREVVGVYDRPSRAAARLVKLGGEML